MILRVHEERGKTTAARITINPLVGKLVKETVFENNILEEKI